MAEELPIEVVAQILGYINPADRREAAQVSRTWNQASQEASLQKDKVYGLSSLLKNGTNVENQKGVILTLDKLDGPLENGRANFIANCRDIGTILTQLTFNGADITHDMLVMLLHHCHNLENLDLSGANSLFMSGQLLSNDSDVENLQKSLRNVKSLSLANIRYLSNATFTRITDTCANLEKLSLAGCQMLFHSSSYIGAKPGKTSSAVLTFEVVKEYIKKQIHTLNSLDLSNTGITNEALYNIVVTPDLKLKQINLASCKELQDKGIDGLCNFQRGIEVIDIGQNSDLTDKTLFSITENLSELTSLSISKCDQLTEESVSRLSRLPKLANVDVSFCINVSSAGLMKGLCSPSAENLHYLNVSGCIHIDDGFVVQLGNTAVNLSHLDMSYTKITDYSLYVISAKMKYLRVLNLAYCRELTDYGVLGIERPLEDMKRPPIVQHDDGECSCSRKYILSSVFTKPMKNQEYFKQPTYIPLCHLGLTHLVPLTNIEGLRELDLTACLQLSDNSIAMVMKFQELKVLKLDQCPKVTDKALMAISDRLPSLEELSLVQCYKITDDGVAAVLKNLKRLVALNLHACDKVTNTTVEAICIHGYSLKRLNISLCKNITPSALEQLEAQRSGLLQVY